MSDNLIKRLWSWRDHVEPGLMLEAITVLRDTQNELAAALSKTQAEARDAAIRECLAIVGPELYVAHAALRALLKEGEAAK